MGDNIYKLQYLDEMYKNLTALKIQEGKDASVYLVQHQRTGKIAVKKYIDGAALHVYEQVKRVSDRHLEKIYDCAGDGEHGIIISEYIGGATLQDYMEHHGFMSEQAACRLILDLLEVLEKVHEKGIVHRDINPNNIMISNDGVLKLIDFGIARQKKEQQCQDTTILGTVGYAAPEQFGFSQTDERTDIYAVGVLLNKLLNGFFPGELIYESNPMQDIIERCTAIDADRRFKSVGELRSALREDIYIGEREYTGQGYIYRMEDCAPRLMSETPVPEKERFVVSWLPGFRSGKIWKNVIATIVYLLFGFVTVLNLGEYTENWQTFLLGIPAVLSNMWLPLLLASNIGNWDRKLWPFCKWPKQVMWVIRVFLWFALINFGVELENYIRYDILKRPLP